MTTITCFLNTQKALLLSERLFACIVEFIPIGIFNIYNVVKAIAFCLYHLNVDSTLCKFPMANLKFSSEAA